MLAYAGVPLCSSRQGQIHLLLLSRVEFHFLSLWDVMSRMDIFGATHFPDVFLAMIFAHCTIAPQQIPPMLLEEALAILMAIPTTTLEEIDYWARGQNQMMTTLQTTVE